MSDEQTWLDRAVDLATENVARDGGPFGALVVRDGEVLGEGANRVTADLDPTAHAEVVAIRAACRAIGDFSLAGASLYTSCEPCPLCLAAALWARVDAVVHTADRHAAVRAGFDDARFHGLLDPSPDPAACRCVASTTRRPGPRSRSTRGARATTALPTDPRAGSRRTRGRARRHTGRHPDDGGHVDVSTFYALFSATCFTLTGLWWSVVEKRGDWMRDATTRRRVASVYLAFLLPALMGLFAQIGGTQSPFFWRASFVVISGIGCVATVRLLRDARSDEDAGTFARLWWLAVILYAVVAVVGVAPGIARALGVTPLQAEATLLVLLVALAHGLVWQFMTHGGPGRTG